MSKNQNSNTFDILNPEGRYTREKPFFPQISQMDADLKNIIQVCFNL